MGSRLLLCFGLQSKSRRTRGRYRRITSERRKEVSGGSAGQYKLWGLSAWKGKHLETLF